MSATRTIAIVAVACLSATLLAANPSASAPAQASPPASLVWSPPRVTVGGSTGPTPHRPDPTALGIGTAGMAAAPEDLTVPSRLDPAWLDVELGDLDGDGSVTNADSDLVKAAIAGTVVLTPVQRYAADLFGDNVIDDVDQAYVYVKAVNVAEGYAFDKPPYLTVHADRDVAPGEVATVLVGNSASQAKISQYAASFKVSSSADWISDPLITTTSSTWGFTLSTTAATVVGASSVVSLSLDGMDGRIRLIFGPDKTITAVAPPERAPTKMDAFPSAATLSGPGSTTTLRAGLLDADGRAVASKGTTWVSSDPAVATVATNSDGSATVTAVADVGSASIIATDASGYQAVPVLVVIAETRPGVRQLTDAEVLFPAPSDGARAVGAGASAGGVAVFSGDELAAAITLPESGPSTAPVVIRGDAPALDTVVVGGESAAVIGRVVAAVTRDGYSLVTLSQVAPGEVYSKYSVSVNTRDLIDRGLLFAPAPFEDGAAAAAPGGLADSITPGTGAPSSGSQVVSRRTPMTAPSASDVGLAQAVQRTPQAIADTADTRVERSARLDGPVPTSVDVKTTDNTDGPGAVQANPLVNFGPCTLSGGASAGTLSLESVNVRLLPTVDARISDSGVRFAVGASYTISNSATLTLAATVIGSFGCKATLLQTKLPIAGPFSAVIGANVKFNVGFDIFVSAEGIGGAQVVIGAGLKTTGKFQVGVNADQSGVTPVLENTATSKFNPIFRATPASADPADKAQISADFYGYLEVVGGVQILPVLPDLDSLPASVRARLDFLKYLEVGSISLRAGPAAIASLGGLGNTVFRRGVSAALKVDLRYLEILESKAINKFLSAVSPSGQPLLLADVSNTVSAPLLALYRGYTPNVVRADGVDIDQSKIDSPTPTVITPAVLQSGLDVELTTGLQRGPEPVLYDTRATRLDVYETSTVDRAVVRSIPKEGLTLTQADQSNVPVISGRLALPADLCDKATADDRHALTFILTNAIADKFETTSYVGSIPFRCQDGSISATPNSVDYSVLIPPGTQTGEFTVRNTGQTAVEVSATTPTWLSLGTFEPKLAVGAEVKIPFTVTCAAPQNFSGDVHFKGAAQTGGNAKFFTEPRTSNVTIRCVGDDQPAPTPPPTTPVIDPPGGRSGGGSGDPHLATFDGVRYDFQGKGEFIYARSTDPVDTFEVQGRFDGSGGVTLNKAFAMDVDGDRVSIVPGKDSKFVIAVNGSPVPFDRGGSINSTLPRGGQLVATSASVDIRWASGYRFAASGWSGSVWSSALVTLPEDNRTMEGLLGNNDGVKDPDLRLRDGAVPPSETKETNFVPSFEDLYGRLGSRTEGWRVNQAESLFDYGSGENTDTFTDLSIPTAPLTRAQLDAARAAAAEAQCRAAGILDQVSLDACILDLVVTGRTDLIAVALANDPTVTSISVAPTTATVGFGSSIDLSGTLSGVSAGTIDWTATGGVVTPAGKYTAPDAPGTYTVTATSAAVPGKSATATITVNGPDNPSIASIVTYGDQAYSGREEYSTFSTFYVTTTGEVWVSGSLGSGQLGTGTRSTQLDTPARIAGMTDVVSVTAGSGTFFAVRRDGQVYAWGVNGSGQLGLGNTADTPAPTIIPGLTNIREVAVYGSAYGYRTMARDGLGNVFEWGRLGDITKSTENSRLVSADTIAPVKVEGLPPVSALSSGNVPFAVTRDGAVYAWSGAAARTDVQLPKLTPYLVNGVASVKSVSVMRGGVVYAITTAGTVFSWNTIANVTSNRFDGPLADNSTGLLGRAGVSASDATPALIAGLSDVNSIGYISGSTVAESGYLGTDGLKQKLGTAFALTKTGSVSAWGWSAKIPGRGGTSAVIATPTVIPELQGSVSISGVRSGADSTDVRAEYCALNSSGELRQWGTRFVQNGELTTSDVPIVTKDLPSSRILAVCGANNLVIDESSRAWGWGVSGRRVGLGPVDLVGKPTQIFP